MTSNQSTAAIDAASAKSPGALRHALDRIRDWFYGEAINDRASLATFLDRNAALVAQKCAIDYCRGKAGTFSQSLFREKPFIEALTLCRWESYAAVLADLTLIVEAKLFESARALAAADRLKPAMAALYRQVLHQHPVPAHRPQGWDDAVAEFEVRQAEFDPAAAPLADRIALHSARRLFETLPIHTNMRQFDEEIVFGAVRFHVVAFSQRLGAQLQPEATARNLLGGE
ncbi:MAG: hypothetical protein AB7R90_11955 [Reyranellaceae bacterium]